ncbi:MAG: ArdC-like ssDNA-binding domain-containing protein [Planctomycetia bacterium]|nr:ArdC-like ssDNA-binding domain-containing protein [Planctomycetia bacterium]
MSAHPTARPPPDWSQLLIDAVARPGVISSAYSRFWHYSVGNQLLAMFECLFRQIPPGPIHTYKGWHKLGRQVKKGEKAISLRMPVQVRRKKSEPPTNDDGDPMVGDGAERNAGRATRTVFAFKPHWFVLSQTEGEDVPPTELPDWGEQRALERLNIQRVPFDNPNGNVQGVAAERTVAVSPIAVLPHKTLFHELAHVVLGHTAELRRMDDHERTPVNLREVEAESVALICCESLGLPGDDCCRGYIQSWLSRGSDGAIPSRSAQRIFRAADEILKAGYPYECLGQFLRSPEPEPV